jgi:hypothetical protein
LKWLVGYKHLSRDECIEAEKAMIRLINNHAALGVAVTVNAADYETWFDGHGRILAGDAYTYCCWQVWLAFATGFLKPSFRQKLHIFLNPVTPANLKPTR